MAAPRKLSTTSATHHHLQLDEHTRSRFRTQLPTTTNYLLALAFFNDKVLQAHSTRNLSGPRTPRNSNNPSHVWCTFWALSLRMICDQLRLHASKLTLPSGTAKSPHTFHQLRDQHAQLRPTASTCPRSGVAALFLSSLTKDSATLRASARRMNTCECFPLQAAPLTYMQQTVTSDVLLYFPLYDSKRL